MSKKKRPGFVRTTISLPSNLRRQMKDCGEEVNWSAIAARAFAAEIGRINAQKEDAGIDDVVQRLRGTLDGSRSELFHKGRLQGEKWAKREATAVQLQRLYATLREAKRKGGVNAENWLEAVDAKRSSADVLAKIVGIEKRAKPGSEAEEWINSSEYVHGFAGGAIHIWKQVARRMRGGKNGW